jgi:ribonuclease-3
MMGKRWWARFLPWRGTQTRERARLLAELQKQLGFRFRDPSLLDHALTHRSFSEGRREHSNERLEFLGDAVLGHVVSDFLFREFPEKTEGELTAMRSLVVSESALARAAEQFGLGRFLALSEGEAQSGGRQKASIISDAFEALIGAVYLDQGIPRARRFLKDNVLKGIGPLTTERPAVNYKSSLQELLQGQGRGRPSYRVLSEVGPEHHKSFEVEVLSEGKVLGRGWGRTKKGAEQTAAQDALGGLSGGESGSGPRGNRSERAESVASRRPSGPGRRRRPARAGDSRIDR